MSEPDDPLLRNTKQREDLVRGLPPDFPKHPIGTFAFVGAYAVVFVLLWYAIYFFIFLARHPVTP